jgi:hypothetical protein
MSRTSDFDGYERDLTDEFTKLRTKRYLLICCLIFYCFHFILFLVF